MFKEFNLEKLTDSKVLLEKLLNQSKNEILKLVNEVLAFIKGAGFSVTYLEVKLRQFIGKL